MKLFFAFLMTLPLYAQGQLQNPVAPQRFMNSFELLKPTLRKVNGEQRPINEIAQMMQRGPNRVAAFNIQSLGQMYQKYPIEGSREFFKLSLRFEAKSLEDAIGANDKWKTVLRFLENNGGSEQQIANAKLHKRMAYDYLKYVLRGYKSNLLREEADNSHEFKKLIERFETGKTQSRYSQIYWVDSDQTLLEQMTQDIFDYSFLNYLQDRHYLIGRLEKHLQKVQETPFNFQLLEDTEQEKGLHEFRRELRWFAFQAKNMNGSVQFFDQVSTMTPFCPTLQLSQLLSDQSLSQSPYNRLPRSPFPQIEQEPCGISKCLFYKVNQTIGQIGHIKDQVETLNYLQNLENLTPTEFANQAENIFQSLEESQAIDFLRSQLQSCLPEIE